MKPRHLLNSRYKRSISSILLLLLVQAQARPVGLSADWTDVEGAVESANALTASGTYIAKNPFLQGPVTLNLGDSLSASLSVSVGDTAPRFDDDGIFIGFGNASGGGYMVAEFDTGTAGAIPFRHRSRNNATNLGGTVDLAERPLDEPAIDPGATHHLDGNNTVSLRVAITRTETGYTFETTWGDGVYTSTVAEETWAPGDAALDTFFFRSRQSADWEVTNIVIDYQSSQGLDPDLVIESIPLPGNLGLQPESLTISASIRNGGASNPLMINGISFGGDLTEHFTAGEFPATLAPGATGTFELLFDPLGKSGVFAADLIIDTNTEDSPVIVPISTVVPLITAFRATPSVVNLGETTALSWVTDPRATLTIDPSIGDIDGVTVEGTGSFSTTPDETTRYVLSASLGDDVQSRSVDVTTLQVVPRGPVEVEDAWRFDEGSGEGNESNLTVSGTFRARQEFLAGQIALAVGDFVSARMIVAFGEANPADDDDGVFVGFGNGEAGGYILSELDTGVVGLTPARHLYRNDGTNLMSTVDLFPAEISNAEVDPGEAHHLNGENAVELNIVLGRTEQGYQMETDWGGTVYTSLIPEATWSPTNHSIDTFFFRGRQDADWELSEIAVAFNLAGQDPDLTTPDNLTTGLQGAGPHMITIPITNGGKLNALEITSAQVVGPDRDLFVVGNLPGTIPAEGAGELTVQFTPGDRRGGFAAILELASNDSGDAISRLDLSTFLGNPGTLLAHYPFDEDTPTTLYDYSGHGYHGRYIAENDATVTVSQTALAAGSAVTFSPGEEDAAFAEVPKNLGLPTFTEFSVSLWFQPDPAASGVSVLFSKGDALGDPFSLAFTSTSLLWVGDGQQSEPFADVVTGQPQHLVVVVSELETTLYLDGEFINTVTSDPFDDSRASAFRIGALNGVFGFPGTVDDLQIYQNLLTQEEAQFLNTNPGQVLEAEDTPPGTADFQITSLQRTADSITLTLPEVPEGSYEIEHSTTLATDSWQVIGTWTDPATPFEDTDAARTQQTSGFYRVKR